MTANSESRPQSPRPDPAAIARANAEFAARCAAARARLLTIAKAIPRHFLRHHEREFVGDLIIDLERTRNGDGDSVLNGIYYVPSPKQKAWLAYLHRRHVLRLRGDP